MFAQRRSQLMSEIRASDREISEPVLAAVERVDRHRFVRPENVDEAYENRPLPIGEGQTISQPLIVAMMTEALGISPGDRVLEVGTGSGYQAAVLAEMGVKVYSVEIIPALAEWSEGNLRGAGYDDVEQRTDDGYFGWEDEAPFDGIIVTAAPDHVPQPLIRQLRVGGTDDRSGRSAGVLPDAVGDRADGGRGGGHEPWTGSLRTAYRGRVGRGSVARHSGTATA